MNGLPARWLGNLAVDRSQIPPRSRRDLWIVPLLALASLAETVLAGTPWPVAVLAVALVAIAVVPFRRQWPLETVVVAFGLRFGVMVAAGLADVTPLSPLGHDIARLLLVYALCRWATPGRAGVGLALLAPILFAGSYLGGESLVVSAGNLVGWLVVVAGAVAMRYRGGLLTAERARVRLAERNLLARELHDTVAHHVSAIAVQAQAARFVGATDPQAALEAIAGIEESANTAIDEMRQMVGILRSPDDEARNVAPTSLDTLVAAGNVHLRGSGDLRSLPAPVAAAVYRIVQESITNANRHSHGLTFVDVELGFDEGSVALDIINDGNPTNRNSSSGYGAIGMQERVDALGGTIESGPRPATGWAVRARIPLPGGSS